MTNLIKIFFPSLRVEAKANCRQQHILYLPDLTFPFMFFWVSVILFLKFLTIEAPLSLHYKSFGRQMTSLAPEATKIIKRYENTEDVHKTEEE